jgi:hypothetical protein
MDQSYAEPFLQSGDGMADSGWGHTPFRRCFAEAPIARDGEKNGEFRQFVPRIILLYSLAHSRLRILSDQLAGHSFRSVRRETRKDRML